MEHICLDLEGVLIPEIWNEVAKTTGEDKFNLTTQDIKNYSELMDMRMDLVKKLGIKISDLNGIVQKIEPFEGAREFLDWARDNFQVTIVSDSFYELVWPLIRKLGTPSINCHNLTIDGDELIGYRLRQLNNKEKVVRALQDLQFTVFASGDSYNDIEMLRKADLGILFRAPQHIKDEYSEIPFVEAHSDLKELFISESKLNRVIINE
tara:strand:- start:21963 stop:22586 length:624 start_codon:yes stop_codon:yes gene_type:complete